MSGREVVLTGRIKPDGNLELDGSPGLPEGPVRVVLSSLVPKSGAEGFLALLDEFEARGRDRNVPRRTAEEIDAAVEEFRQAFTREFEETEALQVEIWKRREAAGFPQR